MHLEVEKNDLSKLSPEKLLELDGRHEAEISRVQRAFRDSCRGPKKTRGLQAHSDLTSFIAIAEKERDTLDFTLKSVMSKHHVAEYEKKLDLVRRHIDCQKGLAAQIAAAKREIKEINGQHRRLDVEELNTFRESLNDHDHKLLLIKISKSKENLNSRMYASKVKESRLINENSSLRNGIEVMLYDRTLFNKHWGALVAQLSFNKRYLVDLIERATLAFNRQAGLLRNIDALTENELANKTMQVAEIEQMIRKISAIEKNHSFLGTKGNHREMMPLYEPEVRRRAMVEQNLTQTVRLYWKIIDKILITYSEDYKRKLVEEGKVVPKDKTLGKDSYAAKIEPEGSEEKNRVYEKLMYQAAMKEKFQMVSKTLLEYQKQTSDYLQRFSFLNNHQDRLISLSLLVENQRLDIDARRTNNQQQATLFLQLGQDLFNALNEERQRSMESQKRWIGHEQKLQQHLSEINAMFNALNCDTTFIDTLLGDMTKVTQFNIKLFLSSLETRVNKVLGHIYHCEKRCNEPHMIKTSKPSRPVVQASRYVEVTQCSECAEQQEVNRYDEKVTWPSKKDQVLTNVKEKVKSNDISYRLHTLSKCRLPNSRALVNKRFM